MKKIADFIPDIGSNEVSSVFSICSSNKFVLETAIEMAKEKGSTILIEATSNQVNQYRGYSGMNPRDFFNYVLNISRKIGLPDKYLFLGGDHLGPLPWSGLDSDTAMKNAENLVKDFVLAGFKKIHIDATMNLGGDPTDIGIPENIIAKRSLNLIRAAEDAFLEYKKFSNDKRPIFYIIGSEVPSAGGKSNTQDNDEITTLQKIKKTLETFEHLFRENNLLHAYDRIVGVVIKTGAEFGNLLIKRFDPLSIREVCEFINLKTPWVIEGHSTDYQDLESLRKMSESGIKILKVGPELTFTVRETLFDLESIEREMFWGVEETSLSNFSLELEKAMRKDQGKWKHYCSGVEGLERVEMLYGFSDRARYFFEEKNVKISMEKLIENLNSHKIPLPLVRQFIPTCYSDVLLGKMKPTAENFIKKRIREVLERYYLAVSNLDNGFNKNLTIGLR